MQSAVFLFKETGLSWLVIHKTSGTFHFIIVLIVAFLTKQNKKNQVLRNLSGPMRVISSACIITQAGV